jgi:hypothetical protein
MVVSSSIVSSTMRKKGVLQLALKLIFELHRTFAIHRIYTLWVLSNKLQDSQKLQLIVYTIQHITIQLQLCHNNSFSTIMQLPYDYNHNAMLMSFFIHPSKFNMWHYEDFSWFFWNIDIHYPLWLFVLDGLGLWHMAQSKVAMWHNNWILETNIYVPR